MFTTIGYLYNQIHPVVLGIGGPDNRWNRMYYSKPVKLHKGVDNPVKFKIRNNNQRDVDLTDSEFTLSIVNSQTNQEILNRTLTIENATRGMLSVTITEEDLQDFTMNQYHYGIKMLNSSSVQYPIYVDDNYSASGVIEIHNDAYPIPTPAVEPTVGAYNSGTAYSSVVAVTLGNNGISTAAYYLSGFSGTITVQGSLEDSTGVGSSDWVDITSSTYTTETGVAYTNFTGMFKVIRFKIELTAGSVDKILYKY
jgi:hypothetical protein